MTKDFLKEYTNSPIATTEQADFIESILKVEDGFMTHKQVGEILCLAAELDNKHYSHALEFIKNVVYYQVAEQFKNDLITEILSRSQLNKQSK